MTENPDSAAPETPMTLADARLQLAKINSTFPENLVLIPADQWPSEEVGAIMQVWRSRTHLAMLRRASDQIILSVRRTEFNDQSEFEHDAIAWSELMAIKAQIGLGDKWCVEVHPPVQHNLGDCSSRDLWILKEQPDFGWRITRPDAPKDDAPVNGSNGHRIEFPSENCDAPPDSVMDALVGRARLLS